MTSEVPTPSPPRLATGKRPSTTERCRHCRAIHVVYMASKSYPGQERFDTRRPCDHCGADDAIAVLGIPEGTRYHVFLLEKLPLRLAWSLPWQPVFGGDATLRDFVAVRLMKRRYPDPRPLPIRPLASRSWLGSPTLGTDPRWRIGGTLIALALLAISGFAWYQFSKHRSPAPAALDCGEILARVRSDLDQLARAQANGAQPGASTDASRWTQLGALVDQGAYGAAYDLHSRSQTLALDSGMREQAGPATSDPGSLATIKEKVLNTQLFLLSTCSARDPSRP